MSGDLIPGSPNLLEVIQQNFIQLSFLTQAFTNKVNYPDSFFFFFLPLIFFSLCL